MSAPRHDSDPYVGSDDLAVTFSDGVLAATLDRPDSLNSLTPDMLATLAETLRRAGDDPNVKAVRLAGAGRGFSSGAGIGADQLDASVVRTAGNLLVQANDVVRVIVALPKPVVAVVHGPAAGVGVSLALACDLVLASREAYFLLAFTKIGLMPDGGASALVAASIGRARAMRLALLAERLSADEAFAAGLISAVHPADELDAAAAGVLATLTSGPSAALRKTKHAINAATLTELGPALIRETEGQQQLLAGNDFRAGTTAFQQRRAPVFTDD